MKKLLVFVVYLAPVILALPNCGYTPSSGGSTSGLKYRAFISNSVTAGALTAGVYIVDAEKDVRWQGAPIGGGNTPGMMAVTPNRNQTVVFSGNNTQFSDNVFSVINNAAETDAGHVNLQGYTESFVISPDSQTAYVAVPNAAVVGQSPGKIQVVALISIASTGEVDIPSVHYLSLSHSGSRLLAFSDVLATLAPQACDQTPSYLFIVTPSDIGVSSCPAVPVPGFDHPVFATFSSDDNTAYVLNCGAECGGTQASVQVLDMTNEVAGNPVPVPAATVAFVQGATMFLAGTPYAGGVPSQPCTGQQTAATTCGVLTIFDLNQMSITATDIIITDGYHNRIAMGANGQLFIGARTCTEILAQPPSTEVRGCLSIYNSNTGAVVIPPANGDATGIEPITKRTVVYVIQGGSLGIYDTATDALQTNQIKNLIGGFVDVKVVDF